MALSPNFNAPSYAPSYAPTQEFILLATKEINANKSLFEEYTKTGQKLMAVKLLKDLTGGGLRDCKEICDLYWAGKLKPDVREDRKEKLEKLAKKPLVDELILKLKNIDEEKSNSILNSILMNLSVDELLSIDEKIEDNC